MALEAEAYRTSCGFKPWVVKRLVGEAIRWQASCHCGWKGSSYGEGGVNGLEAAQTERETHIRPADWSIVDTWLNPPPSNSHYW